MHGDGGNGMALGKRKTEHQEAWISTAELPRSEGHPFFRKLNDLLAEAKFDDWLEERCRPYYAARMGRPSIPPGVYFRMILVGYFEGIASQRGIAWRCGDSLSLKEFLGYGPTKTTPDHSSLSKTHGRLPLELHEQMFQFVLKIAEEKGLIQGTTVAVDATTLEANAALKSLERKDTGEDYSEFLRRLMQEAGIAEPTPEEMVRFDRKRPDKTLSNDEWQSTTDADARITKMKDGTTHLAYKAEHVVDLESDLILAATVHPGDAADTATFVDSVLTAEVNLHEAAHVTEDPTTRDVEKEWEKAEPRIREAAADKGYHSADTLVLARDLRLRTYIPERQQQHRRGWTDKPKGQQAAVYANRRRVRGDRGKRLQRRRSELVERSFAHVCETGGGRRCWLIGLVKVTKRYLLQVAARNLGLILRKLFGIGTARSLQGTRGLTLLIHLVTGCWQSVGQRLREREPRVGTARFFGLRSLTVAA